MKSAEGAFDTASDRFGARYAYTLDGGELGVLETENFSANAMTVVLVKRKAGP